MLDNINGNNVTPLMNEVSVQQANNENGIESGKGDIYKAIQQRSLPMRILLSPFTFVNFIISLFTGQNSAPATQAEAKLLEGTAWKASNSHLSTTPPPPGFQASGIQIGTHRGVPETSARAEQGKAPPAEEGAAPKVEITSLTSEEIPPPPPPPSAAKNILPKESPSEQKKGTQKAFLTESSPATVGRDELLKQKEILKKPGEGRELNPAEIEKDRSIFQQLQEKISTINYEPEGKGIQEGEDDEWVDEENAVSENAFSDAKVTAPKVEVKALKPDAVSISPLRASIQEKPEQGASLAPPAEDLDILRSAVLARRASLEDDTEEGEDDNINQ